MEEWRVANSTTGSFNDLLIKMRTAGISVIVVIYGAITLVFAQRPNLNVLGFGAYAVPAASALLMLVALFIIDRFYYYRLLLGAVNRTARIARTIRAEVDADANFKKKCESRELLDLTDCITRQVNTGSPGEPGEEPHGHGWATRSIGLFYGFALAAGALIVVLFAAAGR